MTFITVGQENGTGIDLYYEDHGAGHPVVLIHGYPLDSQSWERQARVLLEAGYSLITYDRRGFGRSSRPATGYDFDTLAHDLRVVLDALALPVVSLVGFSMGTGELGRYVGTYGTWGIANLAFLSPIEPYLLHTPDNPTGIPRSVFDGIIGAITDDLFAYLTEFFQNFYNLDETLGTLISAEALRHDVAVATATSWYACTASVSAWLEDFRDDVGRIDVPTLIVQGTGDRILPIDSAGRPFAAAVPHARLFEIDNAPHGMQWTHATEVNRILLEFLAQ